MRFSFISATLAMVVLSGSAQAVDPGNNALGVGFSNQFETALKNEVGQVSFDALASKSCNPFGCLGVITAIPCVLSCGVNPLCIINSCGLSADQICGCIGCIPGPLQDILKNIGICPSLALGAHLFAKNYLGTATEDEAKEALALGYSAEKYAAKFGH